MGHNANPRLLQVQLLIGQFVFALAANTLHPILPSVQGMFAITVLESSILPTIYTAAIAVANLAVGILIGSLGARTIYVFASIAGILGSILAALTGSFLGLIFAFVLYAIGIGSAFTSITTLYTHLPEKYRDFGLYHAFFGIGGIVAPALVGLILRAGASFQLTFWFYLAVLILNLIWLLGSRSVTNTLYGDNKLSSLGKVLANPFVIIGIIALGCYAAAEIGVVTFAGNMNIASYSMDAADSGFLLSLFWVCFTLSRIATDPLVKKFGLLALIISVSCGGVIAIATWALGLTAWTFPAIGLFMGPVFPALQKYINNHLPLQHRGIFNGASYASLGGMTSLALPLMGALGELNLVYSFLLSIAFFFILSFLTVLLVRRIRKLPPQEL